MNLADYEPQQLKDMAKDHEICRRISGEMSFFPLCCSTGILKNVQAQPWTGHNGNCRTIKVSVATPDTARRAIKAAKTIRALFREINNRGEEYILPTWWTTYYALDLIHLKCTNGKDDGPSGGYNNYKAAQVAWFDRLNADKRNGKRFNSYNITYSCDHLTEFLEKQDGRKYGQILISKAVDGAHGARVRGCIYTPNIKYIERVCAEALEEMKAELLGQLASENVGENEWQIK